MVSFIRNGIDYSTDFEFMNIGLPLCANDFDGSSAFVESRRYAQCIQCNVIKGNRLLSGKYEASADSINLRW